jgi:hypothetical protein
LAAVVGNAVVTAIDWSDGMPDCKIPSVKMLWDTGAASTIITKDILSQDFQSHLSDPVHQSYRNEANTRVQVSLNLEFSNSLFNIDIVAWVVDQETVPNMRSGILLGQNGILDSLQHRSIPRSIIEAKGETDNESPWGDLLVESYVDVEGSLKLF